MNCSTNLEDVPRASRKLRADWLFIYGLRPWFAWLRRAPQELKPDQLLRALRYDSDQNTSLETELKELEDLIAYVASKINEYVRITHLSPGAPSRNQAILLYIITRLHRPKIVVETGVAQGVSTTFLLRGLHDNKEGRLFSIDLPLFEGGSNKSRLPPDETFPIPKGLQPGWIVPDDLRDRWELLQGDCKNLLVPLLDRLGSVDLFLQDDLHTYKHMLWEFRMTWPHISKEGMLLSHDWEKNPAFCQFAWENALPLVKCCRIACISRLFLGIE